MYQGPKLGNLSYPSGGDDPCATSFNITSEAQLRVYEATGDRVLVCLPRTLTVEQALVDPQLPGWHGKGNVYFNCEGHDIVLAVPIAGKIVVGCYTFPFDVNKTFKVNDDYYGLDNLNVSFQIPPAPAVTRLLCTINPTFAINN